MVLGEEKVIFIRADASSQIGTGHIMRCIALAQAWQERGGQATFLSHCESEPLRKRIVSEGFDLIAIDKPHPDPSDLELTLSILKPYAPNSKRRAPKVWLCLDGYHFTPDYQKAIRGAGIRLLVIDDMNHLPHYHADILLNQNIHAPHPQYHCDPDTTLLLGTRYVLLRREFLKYKDFKRQIPEKAKNILVTMGGADPENVTLKVIEAIKLLNDPDLAIKIIIGPSNPNLRSIQEAVHQALCPMDCVENATDMPAPMAWADLVVSAAGSTCWELFFLKTPSILIDCAQNQRPIVKKIEEEGAAIVLGPHRELDPTTVSAGIYQLIVDKETRIKLVENGKALVDGSGSERVCKALQR